MADIDNSVSKQIVNTFGRDAQLRKIAEEMAEASSSIQSYLNAVDQDYPAKKIEEKRKRMYDEVADAIFAIDQTEFVLDPDKIRRRLQRNNLMMLAKMEEYRNKKRVA